MLEVYAPEIPDWALDQHTLAGKKLGRGLDHFREEGAKLVPPPTADDPYEDEAYRLWAIKQRGSYRNDLRGPTSTRQGAMKKEKLLDAEGGSSCGTMAGSIKTITRQFTLK
jgi:hypothetical protein